ncbi:UDP-N-acetylenolpyruvoylglucosamine reductase [Rhodothalassium salexigens]|uniref:UDP-N-acetylmuramate dehydrogenase n=1 Tax=Rhodothalassium salexigens TaxID=1086 RepID=UPI001913DFCB|nr:UDP-N-acetylmuramate dehydrogenase [Rhodothalassium salexigens]MBK5919702.1 UDP-N-acetylenolpyruvoylglucosamine reductase [Rhodothalassium salexigens]
MTDPRRNAQATTPGRALIARLPAVRGRLTPDAPLQDLCWFRTGGPADVLFEPADAADLAQFIRQLDRGVPVTVLGLGSNVLVRDGGIAGVVVRLGARFRPVTVDGCRVEAGAGASGMQVATAARTAGLAGFEFLRGVPGTVGGAVAMNAGAYGQDTSDVLVEVQGVTPEGHLVRRAKAEIGFGYRQAPGVADLIVTAAVFEGRPDDPGAIQDRMDRIAAEREASQPLRTRTTGSTFKNPPGDRRAWELIDRAGCRGLTRGHAQVSEKHCNFLINRESRASAAELEGLGEEVRRRVAETFGVTLDWEIRRLGRPAPAAAPARDHGSGGGSNQGGDRP